MTAAIIVQLRAGLLHCCAVTEEGSGLGSLPRLHSVTETVYERRMRRVRMMASRISTSRWESPPAEFDDVTESLPTTAGKWPVDRAQVRVGTQDAENPAYGL